MGKFSLRKAFSPVSQIGSGIDDVFHGRTKEGLGQIGTGISAPVVNIGSGIDDLAHGRGREGLSQIGLGAAQGIGFLSLTGALGAGGVAAGAAGVATAGGATPPNAPDYAQDNPALKGHIDKLNAQFGIGTSDEAKNNFTLQDNAFKGYQQKYVGALSRQAYDQLQGAQNTTAQNTAAAGFFGGTSQTDRQNVNNATELGSTLGQINDSSSQAINEVKDAREKRRLQLSDQLINGADYGDLTANLGGELKRGNDALSNVIPKLGGSLFSSTGDALYQDQTARASGRQGLFGKSDPVGQLFRS